MRCAESLFCLFVLVVFSPPALTAQETQVQLKIRTPRDELLDLLNSRVNSGGFDDPKTTMKEVVEALMDRFGVPIDVNVQAFKAQKVDIWGAKMTEDPIPSLREVSFDRVLRQLLAHAPCSAVFLVRDDKLEVTTEAAARRELAPNSTRPLYPLAQHTFVRLPLESALTDVSRTMGMLLLMHPTARQRASSVTATKQFINVPANRAFDTLTRLANLKVVRCLNVLYVSIPEDASGPNN
jgi:hypothetical protein